MQSHSINQLRLLITGVHKLTADFNEIRFSWPASLPDPLPGQFISIRVSPAAIPLLRRPFAFSGFDPVEQVAAIIVQRRGPATEVLCARQPGDELDIIAPLGQGFSPPAQPCTPILVAGGIGLGPMLFWAHHLLSTGLKPRFIFGCRTSAAIPPAPLFSGLDVQICTDDGSSGFHGTTVSLLENSLPKPGAAPVLYGCGPTPMLKALHELACECGAPCYVSMEQTMACGVGACMGCVVKSRSASGYSRVCVDGPVFDSREILWT